MTSALDNPAGRRLFVYGTLAPERAPAHLADVVARFTLLGDATLCGRLYALDAYPGVVCDPADETLVHGRVFDIAAQEPAHFDDDLARLDAYEGFLHDDPSGSLFVRVRCDVRMNDARMDAWAYLYNRDVSTRPFIASGLWTPTAARTTFRGHDAGHTAGHTPE